jgi:hypothetical protein
LSGKSHIVRRNTDDPGCKCLIQKSLGDDDLFPYTSQCLSPIHKSEKIFESGLCSQFGLLFGAAPWAYLNQMTGQALKMSKTSINKNEVFDWNFPAIGLIRKPSKA